MALASSAGAAYAAVSRCNTPSPCAGPGHLYRSPIGASSWAGVPGLPGQFDAEPGQFSLVAEGSTVFILAAYPKPELLVPVGGLHFTRLDVPCQQQGHHGPGPFWT